MLQSLNSAVSGMQSFQTSLDVIGNNISNSNTTSYKASRTDFSTALSSSLNSTSQVGNGVKTSSIQTNFSNGTITSTDVDTDMAISGSGYFLVVDPDTGTEYVTRDGSFTLDENGYLVTSSGMRVQGFTDSNLSSIGDIQIDSNGSTSTNSDATYKGFSVDSSGTITVTMSDGSSFVRGQILLEGFTNPNALTSAGNNLYTGMDNAGMTTSTAEAPGTNGLGVIQSSALEASNVDLTSEMANLITAERGFQANSKVITTSDEMMQDVINLKR